MHECARGRCEGGAGVRVVSMRPHSLANSTAHAHASLLVAARSGTLTELAAVWNVAALAEAAGRAPPLILAYRCVVGVVVVDAAAAAAAAAALTAGGTADVTHGSER